MKSKSLSHRVPLSSSSTRISISISQADFNFASHSHRISLSIFVGLCISLASHRCVERFKRFKRLTSDSRGRPGCSRANRVTFGWHLRRQCRQKLVSGPNVDQEYFCQDQDTRCCAGCWLPFPCTALKKIKDSSYEPQFYCKHCAKLRKSKKYCGICKVKYCRKYGGNWVRLCCLFSFPECAKVSTQHFKDLENTDYYCPDCKEKSNCKLLASKTYKSKIKSEDITSAIEDILPLLEKTTQLRALLLIIAEDATGEKKTSIATPIGLDARDPSGL